MANGYDFGVTNVECCNFLSYVTSAINHLSFHGFVKRLHWLSFQNEPYTHLRIVSIRVLTWLREIVDSITGNGKTGNASEQYVLIKIYIYYPCKLQVINFIKHRFMCPNRYLSDPVSSTSWQVMKCCDVSAIPFEILRGAEWKRKDYVPK